MYRTKKTIKKGNVICRKNLGGFLGSQAQDYERKSSVVHGLSTRKLQRGLVVRASHTQVCFLVPGAIRRQSVLLRNVHHLARIRKYLVWHARGDKFQPACDNRLQAKKDRVDHVSKVLACCNNFGLAIKTGKRMTGGTDPTTIIVHADVYMQEAPSTSDSVIMSSEGSSPPPQASISTTGFDVLDDARLGKVITTPLAKPLKSTADTTDTEVIEEAVPIVQKTLPMPEPKPKIEKNGHDVDMKKSPDEPDDTCLINCIYYTQQCCDCIII